MNILKLNKTSFLIVLLAFAVTFLFTSKINAQANPDLSPLRLTAIPARIGDEDYSLKAKPGETVQTTVSVKNTSNQTQEINTVAEDFIIGEDGKQPIPVDEDAPTQWSLAKWITITPSLSTLKPGELTTLDLLIQVPADALPGGRYAMIMHYPSNKNLVSGSGTGISQRVGTLLYFVVDGDVNQEAYLSNVEVKDFFEFGPVPFSFVMDNRSDIHIHPNIQVEIKNMLGQQSDLITVPSQNVFPNTQRHFSTTWNKKWGLGKYTATVTANYGTAGKVATTSFSFWIIPVRVILGIIFIILAVLSSAFLLKKKMHSTTLEKKKEEQLLGEKVEKVKSTKWEKFKDEQN